LTQFNGEPYESVRLGMVAAMLNPEYAPSGAVAVKTVERIATDRWFRSIDVAHIKDAGARSEAIAIAREEGLKVLFGAVDRILRDKMDIGAVEEYKRRDFVEALKPLIDEACEWEAYGFIVMSGPAVPPESRSKAVGATLTSLRELAETSASLNGPMVMLETFDNVPFGKNALIGETSLAVDLAGDLREEADRFGLVLDLSHLPILGENPPEAVKKAKYALGHVHVGNCVIRHPKHHAYGDNHPLFSIPEGEVGIDQLAEFLEALAEIGYIGSNEERTMAFEIKTQPGRDPEETIANAKETFFKAWSKLTGK